MKKIVVLTLLLSLVACSESKTTSPQSTFDSKHDLSFTLFYSRSSISSPTEFEQHVLNGGKLLSECGITRDDRTLAQQQEILPVSLQSMGELTDLSEDVQTGLEKYGQPRYKPAEKNRFFDSGKFYLTISLDGNKTDIKTSVDAISDAVGPLEKKVLALVEKTRGISPALCKNQNFFGIYKK